TTTGLPPTVRQRPPSWITSSLGTTAAAPTSAPVATHPCKLGSITKPATKNSWPHNQKNKHKELSQKLDERNRELCVRGMYRPGTNTVPCLMRGVDRVWD